MNSVPSYIDSISIVVVAKCTECDKKMSYKNDRRPVGCICDILTFDIKSFLLKFNTKYC
jgi:hypothetical protein